MRHTGWTEVNVTGRIHNRSGRVVPVATAVAGFYDQRGVLIGVEQADRRVPAGATRTFRTSYFSLTSNPPTSVKAYETLSVVPDPE